MAQFVRIEVIVGDGGASTKEVTVNVEHFSLVEECEYEGSIVGVKSKGTHIICAGRGFVTKTPYDVVANYLLAGTMGETN